MKSRVVYLLLCFVIPAIDGNCQRYHFEKITEAQGLSDNRVTCFMKDHQGFLWIGTQNGLNRYDGKEFTIYRPGQKHHALSHEHINDIEQDRKGNLWISTWSGLNVLNTAKDSLFVFGPDMNPDQQKKSRISSALIWDTCIDQEGRVWAALDARDLCYYDPKKNEFIYFSWREFVQTVLPPQTPSVYQSIHKVKRKNDDELWLGTTRGLFSFSLSKKQFRYHGGDDSEDFVFIHYDEKLRQVVFGQKNLFLYDEKTDQLKSIETTDLAGSGSLLANSSSGLWEVDRRQLKAYQLSVHDKKPFSLHHESTKAVFNDDGVDWIGGSQGVFIHSKSQDLFHFIPVFDEASDEESGNVYAILDHKKDSSYYLVSYTNDCMVIINKQTGERKEIKTISGKSVRNPANIFEDSEHRLWILTAKDIFVSDKTHQRFTDFRFPNDDQEYLFNDVIEDPQGNFWFSSLRYGVFLYKPRENSWRLLKHKPDGLFASRPTDLLLDTTRRALWISDFSFGTFRFNFDNSTFDYFLMNTNDETSMQSSLCNALALDHNGDVWVATTSGGLSRYSQKKNHFTTFSMKTGLPENTINAIISDRRGNLWLASQKGLTCMSTEGKIIKHYDQNNGLPFRNFSTPFSINEQGELMIGAAHGFLKFNPDSLTVATPDFPVVITAANISGITLSPDTVRELPHGQNEFFVQFAALTYAMPDKVTYYHQLKGYDKTWVSAGNENRVTYTNLDHGAYVFLVKAVDHEGKESDNVAVIKFTIHAPFWKTWWFAILISIIFITLFLLWTRSLQRKIRSQKILNQVATSLYNQSTYEEVFWTVAKRCIELLHFNDCVIYLLDDRGILVQKAAAGPKSTTPYQIHNPIEIPKGKGIVGTVASTGRPELIANTTNDSRYIVDDQRRHSELAVPIIVDGKVFGVIDTEHEEKNFYNKWHLRMMTEIAAICSAKISRYFVEEQIRSKVARDLHDDMGSSLSSINIMSKIALEKDEPLTYQNYLAAIRENASLMQERLADIVWAINPQNDTMEKIIIRMKEFTAEMLEPLDIQYEFIEDGDLNTARLNVNTRKDFYLIFKEAINNAAKYSACQKVVVHISYLNHSLLLRIEDDGKGFTEPVNGSGNGLRNMKQRARIIKANLLIDSKPGKGSRISLELPYA